MRGLVLAATVALSLTSSRLQAQKSMSVEAGYLTAFEDAAFLVGFRATGAKAGAPGVDFSIFTLPQGFTESVLVLMPNLDITTAAAVGPNAWLLPRFGVSALLGVGEAGGGGVFGLNGGIGLLGRLSEKAGIRLDVTYVRYFGDGESLGLTALTFGYAWMR
jgi:hypothetical protein